MSKDISNSDDVIDSRDVIKRIEELEEGRDEFILNEAETDDDSPSWSEVADSQSDAESRWDETDEGQELKALQAFADEFEGYCPDWKYGVTLVRESHWVEYCKELVKDTDGLPSDLPEYIENNINWDGVAEDLQVDYTSGEFDGVTYWAR